MGREGELKPAMGVSPRKRGGRGGFGRRRSKGAGTYLYLLKRNFVVKENTACSKYVKS
jgi:hypothetical protein